MPIVDYNPYKNNLIINPAALVYSTGNSINMPLTYSQGWTYKPEDTIQIQNIDLYTISWASATGFAGTMPVEPNPREGFSDYE